MQANNLLSSLTGLSSWLVGSRTCRSIGQLQRLLINIVRIQVCLGLGSVIGQKKKNVYVWTFSSLFYHKIRKKPNIKNEGKCRNLSRVAFKTDLKDGCVLSKR